MRLDRQVVLRLCLMLGWGGIAVVQGVSAGATAREAECSPRGWEQTRLELVESTLARWRASLRSTYGAEAVAREAQLRDALSSVRVGRLRMAAAATTFEQLAQALEGAAAEAEADRAQPKRSDCEEVMLKDGVGTGANSWIGYVGGSNQATGSGSAVAAGRFNLASGQGAFVGAGQSNQANGISSLVIGGFDNRATAIDSLVGAGAGHRATGARSVIVGGGYNLASGNFSAIVGGGRDGTGSGPAGSDVDRDHRAYGKWSFIGGGSGNVAGVSGSGDTIRSSTVVGGARNTASGPQAFIGAGGCNVAGGNSAIVVGGGQASDTGPCTFGNTASGSVSFVGGGYSNTASGFTSTVGGGQSNTASGYASTVGGGQSNTASGYASTVVGGAVNAASGNYSLAAGSQASALYQGQFVWADNLSPSFEPVAQGNWGSDGSRTFNVRATGGALFVTAIDAVTGNTVKRTWFNSNGDAFTSGTFTNLSDRAAKERFAPVAAAEVLSKVVALPVMEWSYRGQAMRHLGPVAQDFWAAFGLGEGDTQISTVDAVGVALAAIQGLNVKLEQRSAEHAVALTEQARELMLERAIRERLERELDTQRAQIAELRTQSAAEIAKLRQVVEVLLARTSSGHRVAAVR